MVKVIKRDGRLREFNFKRIEEAIKKAYCEAYLNDDFDFSQELEEVMDDIFSVISSSEEDYFSVEDIQDIVIETLKNYNDKVAKSYGDYRNERTIIRNSKMELVEEIVGLLDNSNISVLTENSNKQAQLTSTQRDLIAGEVSKYISKTSLIPKHLVDAHYKGIIKIHDMDYFLQPIYNCELVNLGDMLQNGTVINKKKIDKPKSLRTAMTLATQISAQVASCTYGGQTITLSHLAPFVRISKNKIVKKYEDMNLPISKNELDKLIEKELKDEIKDSVQTFNYQVSTLMTVNGRFGCL